MSPAAASRSGRVPDEASRWYLCQVDADVALDGDLGALDPEARVVHSRAERRERPPEGAACGVAVGFGPNIAASSSRANGLASAATRATIASALRVSTATMRSATNTSSGPSSRRAGARNGSHRCNGSAGRNFSVTFSGR